MLYIIILYMLTNGQACHANLHSHNLSVFRKLDPFSINIILLYRCTVHMIQPPPASLSLPKFE